MQQINPEATGCTTDLMMAFSELADPRTRACPYPLDELLLVALCAITSGAEHWVEGCHRAHHRLDCPPAVLCSAYGLLSH